MKTVIVGMFDSSSQAKDARAQLIGAGFASSTIAITPDESLTATSEAEIALPSASSSKGGIVGFFENLFGSDDVKDPDYSSQANTYKEAFKRGSYGVSVTAETEAEAAQAEELLNAAGAIDIDERTEQWRKEGWVEGGEKKAKAIAESPQNATNKLQEVQEELKVGKRQVSRGGVRVFTRMTEVPVQESVHLREEQANVQRRVVDRPATEADFTAFKEGSIEVHSTSEEAVVSKSARVTGEVEIGKTITERDEIVKDTVRQTKVEIEQLKPADINPDKNINKK